MTARRRTVSRGGFVFLFVLMVIVVGTIAIGATINAMAFKSRVTELRVQQYRTQHEVQSVKHMVQWWLMQQNRARASRRSNQTNALLLLAQTPGATQRFTLETGLVVVVSVRDAQGTILARLDDSLSPSNYEWVFGVLSRMPQERVDLVRRHGPLSVSIMSASDEVLTAIAENDFELVSALISARNEGITDPATFAQTLASQGIEPAVTQALLSHVTLTPTLWEMQIEVIDPNADLTRRYTMIVEQSSTFPIVHRWGPYIEPQSPDGPRR